MKRLFVFKQSDGYCELTDIPKDLLQEYISNGFILVPDDLIHHGVNSLYIDNDTLKVKPKQQTELTGTTLSNLPVPCTILINGTPYECDSDIVELEFDQPTTYTIRVESWPYQDWSTTYENHA